MGQHSGDPLATDLQVKRRPPADRDPAWQASAWVLLVIYRADGNEHATRLPLSTNVDATRVERLLHSTRRGSRRAALELYACLHDEWGRRGLVRRHPAWDAVFRYLAPLAASTGERKQRRLRKRERKINVR
ncbi:MAG: hypothetical protein ACRDJN_21070 [Chloroflexota bacterium]